ncbi:hypothetical protein LPJ66_010843, partial [Kickxella alabastrina]
DDTRTVDSDYDYDSDIETSGLGDNSSWASLDRRLLQRVVSFLPRPSDRREFCLVNKVWALAGEPYLWAYPEFSTPQQLSTFLRVVTDRTSTYGPHIRGIRFTLRSQYDRHLTSSHYCEEDSGVDAELPTLLEIAQGRHVLSADPAVLRPLLHGSDLSSPPLALRFARMCSPIDSLSIYGFRLRDKYIVNDMMRWNLRELEIIGMPRKPLANLSYLLNGMRSLISLRIESDSPLPTNVWGPLSTRLHGLNKLRIWAPSISGSQLLRSLSQAPQRMTVLHLIGADNDISDDAILSIVQSSPSMQSLVIHSANITARSAAASLGYCRKLTHLELARDQPEASNYSDADSALLPAVASRLNTLSVRNLAISDALVQSAALAIFGLRTLYISGAAALTGAAVGELLRGSTQLAALGLHNCPKLSDSALQGLAQGLSAPTLRVLLIHQCAVQSEGIERVLASFHAIKHFSVKGTEVVRQQFQYAYAATDDNATDPVAEPQPLPVQRSFKPVYPADHFFIKSDIQNQPEQHSTVILPFAIEAVKDGQRLLEPSSPLIKNVFSESSAKRFVPGLMAFSNCFRRQESSSSIGRPRAATVSSAEQRDSSELVEDAQPISRSRSISELPASLESITQEVEPKTEDIAEKTDLDLVATSDGDTSTEVVRNIEIANETATFDTVPRSLNIGNLEVEPATLNKEAVATPEAVVEEVVAAPEAVVEEAVATPEAVVEEVVATSEVVVEEAVATPEAVVEEAVAAREIIVEEVVAASEAVVEEVVATPEAVVEEVVATREVVVEEVVATPEAVVEEAVAAPEVVVEETVAAPEAVVEEVVAAPEAV